VEFPLVRYTLSLSQEVDDTGGMVKNCKKKTVFSFVDTDQKCRRQGYDADVKYNIRCSMHNVGLTT
jgi:hypothetical protein